MTDSQLFSDGKEAKELCKINELIKKSNKIKDGNPTRYHLQTTTDNQDQSRSYRKIIFGEKNTEKPHKTILIVGETGTGKTTLINTMINYIFGVQRNHKVWFEITDEQNDPESVYSQTSIITVYGVYIQETSVDLTIIDTPGYGDTHKISQDKMIAESFLCLCKSNAIVHEINAVCFVIMAHQNRLSDRQQYIFDAVQSLFGKDIADNIVLLFTHSTGTPPKNALKAVKAAKVKCAVDEKNQPIYFLFDNCQEETYNEKYQKIYNQSWDLSFGEIAEFFNFLDTISPKTLQMTKEVLQKRNQLEANISNLHLRVKEAELKRNKLKQTQDALEKHKQDVKEKNNFEYEVEVPYKKLVDIDTALAKKATCCTVCEENCHYPGCTRALTAYWCEVMSKKNHCTVCTNKCHYNKHIKAEKIYETKTRVEKRTYEDLKKEYDVKIGDKESLVNKLEKELHGVGKDKINLVNEAFDCVKELKLIALSTYSLSTLLHIDILIEKLKEINEPEKAKDLEDIKKKADENKEAVDFYKQGFLS